MPGGMHAWGVHAPGGAYMPREHAFQAGGMHPGGVCMACMPPCGLILRDAVSQ